LRGNKNKKPGRGGTDADPHRYAHPAGEVCRLARLARLSRQLSIN
jgi:hypothetical protein